MENETCLWDYSKASRYCCEKGLQAIKPEEWVLTFTGTFFSLSAIIGATLNLFALVALWNSSLMRKPATSFILCLAMSDLIYCIIVLPVDATTYLTGYDWSHSSDESSAEETVLEYVCTLSGLTKHTASTLDWTTLALIAVERYCKIVVGSETHRRFFSTKYKRIMIACLWGLIWVLFGVFGNYGYNLFLKRCTLTAAKHSWQILNRGAFRVAWMAVVVLIIFVSCVKIWQKVRRSTAAVSLVAVRKTYTETKTTSDVHSDSSWRTSIAFPAAEEHHPDENSLEQTRHHSSTSCQFSADDPSKATSADKPAQEDHNTNQQKRTSRLTSLFERGKRSSSKHSTKSAGARKSLFSPQGSLVKRDLSLVKILVITTGTYLFLVAPMSILNLVDPCGQHSNLRCFLYCLYVMLHVVNFFIYVGANRAYRQSCTNLLNRMISPIRRIRREYNLE